MVIPELLAPVGDFDCLKAAVQNGADCVYFGASSFSARASATNFDLDELRHAIQYAKLRNVKTNLTLNTLIKNDEFEDALHVASKAYEYGIDAIIVQDLGLARFLIENFPDLPIHASTQMTVHNLEGVKFCECLGIKRVVMARELSLDYIKENLIYKDLMNIALPLTGSRLLHSVYNFIEPIILISILTKVGINETSVHLDYAIISGYVINMLVTPTFFNNVILKGLYSIGLKNLMKRGRKDE